MSKPIAKIKVTAPNRLFPSLKILRRTYTRDIPRSWDDIAPRLRVQVVRHILKNEALDAVLLILHLPKSVLNRFTSSDLAAIQEQMPFLILEGADNILERFRHRNVEFNLPFKNFENGTAIEYALAESYFNGYIKKGDAADLLKLTATLARPSVMGIRLVPKTRQDVERIDAKHLEGLPLEYQTVALMYFAAVKQQIQKNYGKFLFEIDEDDTDFWADAAVSDYPNFGWWATFLGIAQTGVFGNYEAVLQTNFHRIAMFLIEKRKENTRLKVIHKKDD